MAAPPNPHDAAPAGAAPAGAAPAGEQTKRLIIDTAVRLFREQGYDKTTMRAIATAAGLSVGNAYYYFPSKDHLVQEFYTLIQHEHRAAAAKVLATETEFGPRLHGVLTAVFDVMTPYHGFAGKFIKVAADPDSPLSPFSRESGPARKISLEIFRELVAGTVTKIDNELRTDLPDVLWLGQLGATLFWVHDRSPGQRKTRVLIDRAVPLVDRLVGLSRLRVLRPVVRESLALYRMLRD
jgi:AcrR family transcriptional regulator